MNPQFLGTTPHTGRFPGAQKANVDSSLQQERNSLAVANVKLLGFDAAIRSEPSVPWHDAAHWQISWRSESQRRFQPAAGAQFLGRRERKTAWFRCRDPI